MLDLNHVFKNTLDNMENSGELEKLIEERMKKQMTDIIDNQLRSYSKFSQQLEKHIEEKLLHIDLSRVPLEKLSDAITKVLSRQLQGYTTDTVVKQVSKNLESILDTPPSTIKLSDLLDEFKTMIKDDSDEHYGVVSFGISTKDKSGYCWVYLDENENKTEYTAAYRFGVSKEGRIFGLKINNTLDADVTNRGLFCGDLYGFERKLFQLAINQSRLDIDIEADEFELSWCKDD